MNTAFFEQLNQQQIISTESLQKIKERQRNKLISVFWELKTLLYLGVLLLAGGLGIIVYKNIVTIGHQSILALMALTIAACFYYCFKHKLPFSKAKVQAPNAYFDYVLLLGCLLFISFVSYLQFQYNVFGSRYGLATFIPMLVLFTVAYYFDHLGILSIAITNLAAWAGIAVTPAAILKENDFDNFSLIVTGIVLGILLVAASVFSISKKLKAHFSFTYTNFGMHLLFISSLAGMFHFEKAYFLFFLLLSACAYFFYLRAFKEKSFYYILILSLYCYIGLSYVAIRLLFYTINLDMGGVYLAFFYFIGSAIALIVFLIRMNKKIKAL